MSRCKCTGCNSRDGIGLVGDVSFSLKNISSFMKCHTNVKHHETKCKAQEPRLWIKYFWSYCPLNIENCLHGNTDFHQVIFVCKTMKTLLRLHRCAFTLESPMSTYPISIFCNIINIVIIHAVNHSYNLSFFSINIKMFSLFLHILCSKRGRHLFSSRKQILVIL